MAYVSRIETDPLGHRISLEAIHLPSGNPAYSNPDEVISQVIRKPAMLIKVSGHAEELYFFRSVSWSHTLLIGAACRGEYWAAFSCVQNPSSAELSELLKKGKQLI